MSIRSEELQLLLLILNKIAELKKQTKSILRWRLRRWRVLLLALHRSRIYGEVDSSIILPAARKYTDAKGGYKNHVERCLTLKCNIIEQTFNRMSDLKSLRLFRLKKSDVIRMAAVVGLDNMPHSSTNRYSTIRLLCTAIFLWKLAFLCRWHDLEVLIGKHLQQLAEIF